MEKQKRDFQQQLKDEHEAKLKKLTKKFENEAREFRAKEKNRILEKMKKFLLLETGPSQEAINLENLEFQRNTDEILEDPDEEDADDVDLVMIDEEVEPETVPKSEAIEYYTIEGNEMKFVGQNPVEKKYEFYSVLEEVVRSNFPKILPLLIT